MSSLSEALRVAAVAVVLVTTAGCSGSEDAVQTATGADLLAGSETPESRAATSRLKADLRTAATAQEMHRVEAGAYATVIGELSFIASAGNQITVSRADAAGYCLTGTAPGVAQPWSYDSTTGSLSDQPC